MPLVTSSAPQPSPGLPRIPKLSYRNCGVIETSTASSRQSTSTIGTTVTADTYATSLTSPPPSEAPHNGPRSPASVSTPQTPPSAEYEGPNTKKKGSFFGFFTVKDPSIVAMQQYEEQMKREGIYKKDTQHRPLLKSTEKWDGRPETLARQKKEAEIRAKQQQFKEREEALKELKKRQMNVDKRRSLGNFGLATSLSMENMSSHDAGNPLGFDVNSTYTLGSRSSHSNSANPPTFQETNSYGLSDSSSARRSQSETGSNSDGDSHRHAPFLVREGSTKSHTSSISSDVAPFLDKDMPAPPDIPAEYRKGKIPKPVPAIPLIPPHHQVLPTVIEPSNEASTESLPDQNSDQRPLPLSSTPAPKTAPESLQQPPPPSTSNVLVTSAVLRDEEVVVKSSGPNILSPPTTVKRKAQGVPFLAGEAEELQLPASPASIVKTTCTTPRRKSAPSQRRPIIPEPTEGTKRETSKRLGPSRLKVAIGSAVKSEALAQKGTGDSEGDGHVPERNITPTPAPGGRGLFKAGRLGLFLKEKGDK